MPRTVKAHECLELLQCKWIKCATSYVCTRALTINSGPAPVGRSAIGHASKACCAQHITPVERVAHRRRASPPNAPPEVPREGPRRALGEPSEAKTLRYMREHMPENQVETKCIKRLPNLEKACIRMPWDALEKKRAVVTLF